VEYMLTFVIGHCCSLHSSYLWVYAGSLALLPLPEALLGLTYWNHMSGG